MAVEHEGEGLRHLLHGLMELGLGGVLGPHLRHQGGDVVAHGPSVPPKTGAIHRPKGVWGYSGPVAVIPFSRGYRSRARSLAELMATMKGLALTMDRSSAHVERSLRLRLRSRQLGIAVRRALSDPGEPAKPS